MMNLVAVSFSVIYFNFCCLFERMDSGKDGSDEEDEVRSLRWFETVFHFPFQLNFMKGLFVCSERLLLLVDSRCSNNLSTYQLLYCH